MQGLSRIKHRIIDWVDSRLPLAEIWGQHAAHYYVPKNLNFWYFFGVFSLVVLVNQIITGIWLTMYYIPTADGAFDSVEHIMRHVHYGWLLRYMHTTGASAFFIVTYLHMYRAIMYGSYKKPRELLWLIGTVIYVFLMAAAFTGYVLPWGQMSYWAAKVIMSLWDSIPFVGKHLSMWIQGDYHLSGITLHRFFAYHVAVLPMGIVILTALHVLALHKVGSNNPEGVEIKQTLDENGHPIDGITFHPYYTMKDLMGLGVFLMAFSLVLFFFPTGGGHFLEPENFIPANRLVTPSHIAPVWYLAPFYAVLRAVPGKTAGIIVMAAAVSVLFVFPWLDRSPVKSIRYKGIYSKCALTIFIISFIGLGYIGTQPPSVLLTFLARVFTTLYFAFFLLMPFYTRYEKHKVVPTRIYK